MTIDTDRMVSMSEANQNFSSVARLVDEKGEILILKNNKPRYVVIDFAKYEQMQFASQEEAEVISDELLKKNEKAYKELAK